MGDKGARAFYTKCRIKSLLAVVFVFVDDLFGEGVFVFDIDAKHPVDAHPEIRDPGKDEE